MTDPTQHSDSQVPDPAAGLCAACVYARVAPHPRGGDAYWRCGKHDEEGSFPKYPRLPVLVCDGYRSDEKDTKDALA